MSVIVVVGAMNWCSICLGPGLSWGHERYFDPSDPRPPYPPDSDQNPFINDVHDVELVLLYRRDAVFLQGDEFGVYAGSIEVFRGVIVSVGPGHDDAGARRSDIFVFVGPRIA
jgi:hypothetical protein